MRRCPPRPSNSPVPPTVAFPTRDAACGFEVHGTEMAKLGPESWRRINSIQPHSGDLPREKNLERPALSCMGMQPVAAVDQQQATTIPLPRVPKYEYCLNRV